MNYPNPDTPATSSLQETIFEIISERGPIPFPQFMEMALYDPDGGYYSSGAQNVGKDGDFFTSVSVGPLFGQLLALRFISWWENNGKPEKWRLLEIGANDGKLAADILGTIQAKSSEAWEGLQYAIAEPLPTLRATQKKNLEAFSSKLLITSSFEKLTTTKLPGIAFGNEILDALPFHAVKIKNSHWIELKVTINESQSLSFCPSAIPEGPLRDQLTKIGTEFPESYQTEVRTCFGEFLSTIQNCLEDGTLIFIDYGFASEEYYFPSRTTGTLRTYSKHTAGEDPLETPGKIDITAHVDFTELALAAEKIGYTATSFSSQSSYLTHLAKPLILSGGLSSPKEISHFQTLIHPAHLGEKFHAIEFQKNSEMPDLVRHRLAL